MLAETDEWVAMSSEWRAIAVLPGAAAGVGPQPEVVYVWEKEGVTAMAVVARRAASRGRRSRLDAATGLNRRLHELATAPGPAAWRVLNPNGAHALACGLDAEIDVEIDGHVGYYCAGMNKRATVRVHGNASTGIAENLMSGRVVVDGNASQSAGATGRGGLLVVHGDASSRCGISMKGIDIVVGGSVGHMSAFMAQTGCLVVCGDAGDALGDSIYEARLYVRGSVAGLGADCVEKELRHEHVEQVVVCSTPPGSMPTRRSSDATGPRGSSTTSRSTTRAPTESWPSGLGAPGTCESHLFDRTAIAEIQRAAREGIYDIRGFGAKRRLRTSTTCSSSARASRAIRSRGTERSAGPTSSSARFATKPLELEIPSRSPA